MALDVAIPHPPSFTPISPFSERDDYVRAHRDIYEWAVQARQTFQAIIAAGGSGGGGGDHGALTGLSDDDHPQYAFDTDLSTHAADTTTVHGITNTALLVVNSRTISTTAPLAGGGDLSANRTLTVDAATTTAAGVSELATTAEVLSGVDNDKVVTPFGLHGVFTWTAYTSTLSGGSVQGDGTIDAEYIRINKMCFVKIIFTLGSTSTVSGWPQFSLPFQFASVDNTPPGICTLLNAGVAHVPGWCYPSSTIAMGPVTIDCSGTYPVLAFVSTTVPITWGTGDKMSMSIWYETL